MDKLLGLGEESLLKAFEEIVDALLPGAVGVENFNPVPGRSHADFENAPGSGDLGVGVVTVKGGAARGDNRHFSIVKGAEHDGVIRVVHALEHFVDIASAPGVYGFDFRAQVPACQVDIVDIEVQEYAAGCGDEPSLELGVLVQIDGLGTHHERLADGALVDELLGVGVAGIEAANEADEENLGIVLGRGPFNRAAFFEVDSHRLLTEDMEPVLEGFDGLRGMNRGRGYQEYGVQTGILHHFIVVRVELGDAEGGSGPFEFFGHDAACRNQVRAMHFEAEISGVPLS